MSASSIIAVIVLAMTFALVLFVSNEDFKDAQEARSLYCEMVAAWHSSGGEYGWPPFEGECDQ